MEDDNRRRYSAIKDQIQRNSGRTTTNRQLTPHVIPRAHTPITINPNKGKLLLKPDKIEQRILKRGP